MYEAGCDMQGMAHTAEVFICLVICAISCKK